MSEEKLLKYIAYEPVTVEQLIEGTGVSSAEITATLLTLEIKGQVKRSNWGYEAIQSASLKT